MEGFSSETATKALTNYLLSDKERLKNERERLKDERDKKDWEVAMARLKEKKSLSDSMLDHLLDENRERERRRDLSIPRR
jgi:hypothetical protein